MKKIAYLLTFILSVCSFFMFGCTNKYKNLKLELDNNEIVINVTEGEESFETVTATVKGAGKGVSTAVVFSTQSTNITLEPQEQEENSTQCKIIANPSGTGNSAVVTVATLEGGKTATVNVTIVRKIESATYNTAYNPAVSLNGRLQINTGLAINIVPENSTQNQFKYELDGEYEGVSLTEGGELVVGSVMPADGKIKVIATNTANTEISINFEIDVVKGIGLREQVTIQTDGKVLEDGLIIEPNKQSSVTVKFGTTMSVEPSYYSFLVSSQNENIIPTPVATSNLNEFNVVASSIGETALTITVYVTGYDASFASFTFDLPVTVKNVPTGIIVTTKNSSGASTVVGETDVIEIYDVYADGVLGTQLTTVLTPTPTYDSDSTFSINILGETNVLSMLDVYYSDETKVESLSNLPSSVNLFFRVNQHTSLTETINFQIEIISTFDTQLKQVINAQLIKGIASLGVSKEGTDITSLKVVLGETETLIISAKGSNQESLEVTQDNVKLDFGTTGADYISSQRNTEKPEEFAITANKCGTTNIVFFTNNGISKEIEVIVYQPYTTFVANYQMPNSDIGDQTYYLDGENINSVKTLVFALSASLKINITYFADEEMTTPVNATILDAYIISQTSTAVAVYDKLYITGLKAEVYSNLTLNIVSYDENGELKTDTLEFTAKSYVPLSQVQLNHNNLTLLDSNTLSALDRSEGEVILELRLSPINATFNTGDDITWAVAGATTTTDGYIIDGHIVKLDNTELRSNQTKVSVYLSDTKETATITVVATAKQYSRSYTQSCTITVRKCVQIDNVEITNLKEYGNKEDADYDLYFNATKGLANVNSISEIATSEGATNYFDVKTRISPANVTNGQVVYVVKNWDKESNTEITDNDKKVVIVSSSGRVYANTAGYAKIYVIPADSLTEETTGKATIEYNRTTYSYNADLTKIIYVQVADGSENNKIRIESASDFIGINTINGLKLHYELQNNIDLASVGAINPIGYIFKNNAYEVAPFTGSITGSLANNHRFTISNVSLNMAASNGVYIGLFANIATGAKVENLTVYINTISHSLAQTSSSNIGIISAINNGEIKNCEINVNNLTASNLAGIVNMGVIAGLNNGTIENCKVTGNINLTYTTGIKAIKFGGIAGENNGTIKSETSSTSTSNETQYLVSYNFSDVDVMLNITTNNTNIKINEEEDFSAVSFGGIVGYNYGTVNSVNYGGILKGYSKLGGIAGTNEGLIENCVNQGNVYSQGGSYVGGIVAYNTKTGNFNNNSVQSFNYVGKTANHTAVVGYSLVGLTVGADDSTQSPTNNLFLSYYSLRKIQEFVVGTSNYETDNLNGTHYYGDMLVLGNGECNISFSGYKGVDVPTANHCRVYIQNLGEDTAEEKQLAIYINDSINTVPSEIVASVKVANTQFADAPTKVNETTMVLPYFEAITPSQEIAQTLYNKNTYNIADLITVDCTPNNATQKFIVQTSNSSVISLDKQGRLHVVGTGSVTLTISSIFNSCESKTITVHVSYPVGTLKYVNASGTEIEKITMRKDANTLIKPVMSYTLEDGSGNAVAECKVISTENISITAILSNNTTDNSENYITLNNSAFTLNSSIIVSSQVKTETNKPAIITLTPTVSIQGNVIATNLLEKDVEVHVTEGATDLTFSINNIEVSQTDIIEFTVYVHTDVDVSEINIFDATVAVKNDKYEQVAYIYTDYADKFEITASTPYEYAENIVAVNFTVKLKADYVYEAYAQDTEYKIEFIDYTILNALTELPLSFYFNFTVKAKKVENIFANNYNGINVTDKIITYNEPDNSNSITPGQTGILELDVHPFYANIKDITIVNTGTSEDNVTFEQIIRKSAITSTGNSYWYEYKSLFPRADYIENGIKVLPISKASTLGTGAIYRHDKTDYLFDGKIYLKTLIKSGVSEGSKYELTITLTTLEDIKITKVISLTAVNSLAIEMTYSYKMENGQASDNVTVYASTSCDDAPTIYLPAGVESCDGELIIKTFGFNGTPDLHTDNNLSCSGSNPYTLDTSNNDVNDNGHITATINIPLENGTSVEQKVYIKYQIVDIVIPNLLLNKDASTVMESILPLRVNDADQVLEIHNNWQGADATGLLNALTKSTVSNSNGNLEVAEDGDVLKLFWFVGNEELVTNYQSKNLGESLEFITGQDGCHYLRAKNTLTNQKLTFKFSYYYNEGKLTIRSYGSLSDEIVQFTAKVSFTTNIGIYTDENLPAPVYSQTDFEAMEEGHHYILMNDIVLENYKPLNTEIASFDGNGFNIKILFADYSGDSSSVMQDTLNLGLFEEIGENTTIKNVKVVVNSKDATGEVEGVNVNKFDLTNTYRSVNYGTIAAVNNGVITNCTVSFEDYTLTKDASNKYIITEPSADRMLEFITNESVAGDLVNNIGGLVAINNGYVTNSKVEQPINMIVNIPTVQISSSKYEQSYTPYYFTSTIYACVSKIKGNGNIAGLVATNEGVISSSYVKGIEIINNGAQSSSKNTTAGFVGENGANGKVVYSYAEGTFNHADLVRATIGGIISNGNIGAFAYINKGLISNSYANIKVTTNARASGFVYDTSANGSSIDSCFTLSAIEQNNNAHNPFTGTSTTEVLAHNNIESSYYLRIEKNTELGRPGEDFGNTTDEPASEIGLNELTSMGTFSTYSFIPNNIESDENKYIWKMATPKTNVVLAKTQIDDVEKEITYPQLITANQITLSMRQVKMENSADNGTSISGGNTFNGYPVRGGTEKVKYIADKNLTAEKEPLLVHNPYIVANEQDYINIVNNATTSAEAMDNRKVINSIVRFVRDVEFSDSMQNSPTASVIFKGALDGNGMTISNVKVNTFGITEGQTSLGFISELNGNPDSQYSTITESVTYGATIKNLNFEFAEVYGNTIDIVGGVVGKVENGFLLNIKVSGKDVVAVGKNITGGVFGLMVGGSRAVNLESSISVSSEYRNNQDVTAQYNLYNATYQGKDILGNDTSDSSAVYYETTITNQNSIGYAGGVGGIIDIYGSNSNEMNAQGNADGIKTTGAVNVLGENVGGVFGLVGSNTKVSLIQNIISSQTVSLFATKVAGGIIGEHRGDIQTSYIENQQQSAVETTELGRASVYANTSYFKGECQAIGGIAGLLIGGKIKNCYSKVDVRNANAQFAGGAVGRALGGSIKYTYASGSVLGTVTGGFIGHIAAKNGMFDENNSGMLKDLEIEDTHSTTISFNVAVNNWLFADYEQANSSKNAFNTFIGAVTENAKVTLTANHATQIMFSNSFNTSTNIKANNGKLFDYNPEALVENYCLVLKGDFATTDDLNREYENGSTYFKQIQLEMHHPAKMVRTQEELGTNESSKGEIYERFSNVLWSGKTENNLRYLKLLSRSEYFTVSVSNWQQLESAIEARSDANISLESDIVVEGIIDEVYCGTLEGNEFAFVFADADNSYLYNAYVKVGSQTEENKDNLVEQYCYGVFAITSQAMFDNVNVRLEKNIDANLYNLTNIEADKNAYIGALVAYATDSSSFNNCFVQATKNYKLSVAPNDNINQVYAGGLIGYLESSTLLADGSTDIVTTKDSNSASTFAVRNAEETKLENGIEVNVTSTESQCNVGGLIGATGAVSGGISDIVTVTLSYTSIVRFADNVISNSTANNIGGLIGYAKEANISNCSIYGSVDNSNAIKYELNNKNKTTINNFGVVVGRADTVNASSLIVNSQIELYIHSDTSHKYPSCFEVNAFAGTKDKNKTKLIGTNNFTVNLTCDYTQSGSFGSDAHNTIKLVSNEKDAQNNLSVSISLQKNTDQVIALNPKIAYDNKNYEEEGYKTEAYLYGGTNVAIKKEIETYGEISATLKTYYAQGTYETDTSGKTIIGMNEDYTDRPIVIPAKIGNNTITSIDGGTGNRVRLVFESVIETASRIINLNPNYYCDGVALYKSDHSTIFMYASANTAKSYTVDSACGIIANSAFKNAKNLQTINTAYQIIDAEVYDNLMSIGEYAFAGCEKLSTANQAPIRKGAGISNGQVQYYGINDGTSNNFVIYNTFKNVKTIGRNAFDGAAFQNLYFPQARTINGQAFSNMKNLTEVIIAAELLESSDQDYFQRSGTHDILVSTIGKEKKLQIEGTYGRMNLKSNITATEDVIIGRDLFYGTTSLEYLTMPLSTYKNGEMLSGRSYTFADVFNKNSADVRFEVEADTGNEWTSYIRPINAWTYNSETCLNLFVTGTTLPDDACFGMGNFNLYILSGVTTIGKYALSADFKCANLLMDEPFYEGEESTHNTTIFLPSTIKYLADGMAYMRRTTVAVSRAVDYGGISESATDHLSFTKRNENAHNIPIEGLYVILNQWGTYPPFAAFIPHAQIFINVPFDYISINCIATASDISSQGNTTFGGFGVLSYMLSEMIDVYLRPNGCESILTYTFCCPDQSEFVFREGNPDEYPPYDNGFYYDCAEIPPVLNGYEYWDDPAYSEYPYKKFPEITINKDIVAGGN